MKKKKSNNRKKKTRDKKWALATTLFFVIMSTASGMTQYWGEWSIIAKYSATGLVIGLLGAIYIFPKAFIYPTIIQTGIGALAGGVFMYNVFGLGMMMALGVAIGAILGRLANYWIGTVNPP